jgi:hypothetical protein
MEPVLSESHFFDPPNFTWPYGTHVCVVEVDTETGSVTIPKYVAVDDCGPVVNPAIVDGQLHGGIAQGIAQALYEEAVYDDGGNLITGSMMNYMIPGAPEIPNMILDRTETPSPTNPMGVKGIGESGAIAAQPAVINAVIDALSHLGVTHIDMPGLAVEVWGLSRTPPARTERCNRRPKGKGLRSSRTHHKEETQWAGETRPEGRPQRGGDGQGQGPHERGRWRPDRRQEQESRGPLRPAQRYRQGEEGPPEGPL